jgi:proteasome lid subunit RPN8/RPN11
MAAAKRAVSKAFQSSPNKPPSPVASCPVKTGKALLEDANVKAGLKKAAQDSDIAGKNPTEQGGFILKDPKTGQLSVERWPKGKGASIQPVVSADGKHNGKDIVGSFHTHPNVGKGWKQEPSDADVNFVKNYPKTAGNDHFVVSKEKIYHIDNKGGVSEAGKTTEVLK